jgi:hypothetical protein
MERKVSLDDKSPETIEMLADVFDDLQTTLEPIRDKALDERARLVGYAQCAEQMIKIIADQVAGLRALARKKVEAVLTQAPPVLEQADSLGAKRRPRRLRAKAKEAKRGGDNSA